MRNYSAVVIFCGPRTKLGFPSTTRITRAIEAAKESRCRLYVVGRGPDEKSPEPMKQWSEVDLFKSMAKEHGVEFVTNVYVPARDACTEVNAFKVAEALFDTQPHLKEVFLVTDSYHMKRAKLHLEYELKHRSLFPTIFEVNVVSATRPTPEMVDREESLIATFQLKPPMSSRKST